MFVFKPDSDIMFSLLATFFWLNLLTSNGACSLTQSFPSMKEPYGKLLLWPRRCKHEIYACMDNVPVTLTGGRLVHHQ